MHLIFAQEVVNRRQVALVHSYKVSGVQSKGDSKVTTEAGVKETYLAEQYKQAQRQGGCQAHTATDNGRYMSSPTRKPGRADVGGP